MRYRFRDLPALVRTATGRSQLCDGFLFGLSPATSRLAALYRRIPLRNVHVVAVVGSYGKTTTARAITTALGKTIHPNLALNSIGRLPLALFRLRPGDGHGVVEVGIDGRHQMSPMAKVIQPDIVVVTAVGTDHNRSLESLEVTRDEKAHMVRALFPSGIAVLNGDDPNVTWMASQTRARIITFGFGESNHVRATDYRLDWPHGSRFRLHAAGEEREVSIRLLGRHHVYPVLAAVAVASAEGFSLDEVLPRLADLPPAPGRLCVKVLEDGITLLCDDMKSSLETIYAALDILAEIPAERRVVVLGLISEPAGSQAQHYRALASRIAAMAKLGVFVGSFQKYRTRLTGAGMPATALHDAGQDVLRVVEILRDLLRPGDVVLIKGRFGQRLARIALALEGRPVRCNLSHCKATSLYCRDCGMLERGWWNERVPF
jgi:UDP-N-acetylmuramoyl-tripeptide--D-alanyl-D-alanine ligase